MLNNVERLLQKIEYRWYVMTKRRISYIYIDYFFQIVIQSENA